MARKKLKIDRYELRRLYQAGQTSTELAAHFGCSRFTIIGRLNEFNIHSGQEGKNMPPSERAEARLSSHGYVEVYRPDHSRANNLGYVKNSILVWELYHLRPFPKDRIPHHLNGVKDDDRPCNIISLLRAEHAMLHAKTQSRNKAGSRFAKETNR